LSPKLGVLTEPLIFVPGRFVHCCGEQPKALESQAVVAGRREHGGTLKKYLLQIESPCCGKLVLVLLVTYTRCRINTINSPDDEHMSAQNTWFGINIYEKRIVSSWLFTRITPRCTVNKT
jgi:hypothetical protein